MRVHTIALAIGLVSGSLNYTNAYAHQVTPEQREKSHAMLAQATAGSESLGNISRLAGATSSSSADYYNCSIDKYINAYDIVSVIKSHDSSCINPLFNVNVTQARTLFSSRNVNAVANALLNDLRRYDGTNDQNVAEMMYFIKAYTFTNFNFKDEVGRFTDSFKNTVTAALDAYFANPKSQNTDSQNAWVLQQALAIVDSIEQNAHFLPVIKRVINNYDVEMRDNLAMSSATYNVFGVLFRGHQNEDYQLAAGSNTDMADTLYRFYKKNRDLLGTKNEDILRETVREMARFVQYEGIRTTVSGYINEILTDYSIDGEGSVLWVGAAEMAEYYDAENCANYNVCDLGSELKPRILDTRHACSDTLRIRSQHTYGMQNEWICDTLGVQEDYFHQLLQTNNKPNTADFNDALELVIFDSQADYKTYGGIIYDISTNNGGMYLEGNPMRFNNQARFIAYEKDEYRPDFHVWNLQHEYVHYLDGRFNMAGDFADSIDANTIWWIEGLAEYVAYRDGYEKAIDIARTQAYKLSEIFENTYSSGQDRIYRWGYLAVRFMFENHRSDVDEILAFMRKGQYQAYQTYIDNIGTRYDAEFNQWLTTVQLGENYIVKTGPTDEASIGSGVDTDTTSDTSLVVDWDANEGVISIDDEWKNL